MPRVSIRIGFFSAQGEEEVLTEYLCDVPDCANPAVRPLGVIAELRQMAMVCEEHIPHRDRPQPGQRTSS